MKNFTVTLGNKKFDLSDREDRINYSIKKWHLKIKGSAFRLRNVIADESDLYQEAIISIINAADKWKPQHADTFDTFVFRCITNRMKDISIRNRFALNVPSGSLTSDSARKEIPQAVTKTKRVVDYIEDRHGSAIDFLDIKDVINAYDKNNIGIMYFMQGKTLKEIANILNISCSTVARRIKIIKKQVIKKFR
ncbi:MAG: sigma-70 family RNA polymerase sigma factor [Candidatus Hodarchaeales archaeon]|jgi:RNA polymerase sigma factor (sigma-70 family)